MKEPKDKLNRNIVFQVSYQSLVFLYPLITTPLISRALGKEMLGIYSFTYSIAYYFSLITGLGIHTYGSRLISVNRNDRKKQSVYFWELYTIQLLASCFVILFYIGFVFSSHRYIEYSLLQGITILTAMIDISWFLSGLEKFGVMILRNSLIKVTSLILVVLLVRSNDDLGKYILIVAGAGLLGQLSIWPAVKKYIGYPRVKLHHLKKHIPMVIKLFFPVIALNSYVLIDKVMLGIFTSMGDVGYYENCDRLIRMPIGLSSAASAVMIPRSAYYIANGEDVKNNNSIIKTLKYNYILIMPIMLGLWGIAPKLVPWYMGEEFFVCSNYIRVLVPIIFFMVTNNIIRVQFCIAKEKDTEYVNSIIGAMLVNLILNIILIKPFKIYGVIIGSMLSEIWAFGYLLRKTWSVLNFKEIWPDICISMIGASVMLLGILQIGKGREPNIGTSILQVFMGLIIYGVACFFLYFLYKAIRKWLAKAR